MASTSGTQTLCIGQSRNLTQRFVTLRNEAKRVNPNAGKGDRCAGTCCAGLRAQMPALGWP